MEMRIFERDGERWTRFKILLSQYRGFKKMMDNFGMTQPVKKNSRYIYFEAKGDFLNAKKEAAE